MKLCLKKLDRGLEAPPRSVDDDEAASLAKVDAVVALLKAVASLAVAAADAELAAAEVL